MPEKRRKTSRKSGYDAKDPTPERDMAFQVFACLDHGVVLRFCRPIDWIGLPTLTARQLAHALLMEADALDRHRAVETGKPRPVM